MNLLSTIDVNPGRPSSRRPQAALHVQKNFSLRMQKIADCQSNALLRRGFVLACSRAVAGLHCLNRHS
jgi:hypothetical protein